MSSAFGARKDRIKKKTSAAVAPHATINTRGTAVTVLPDGQGGHWPVQVRLVAGGTFGSENLTMAVRAVFEDGTTNEVTKVATGTGNTDFTLKDIADLIDDGKTILSIVSDSESDLAGGGSIATHTVELVAL